MSFLRLIYLSSLIGGWAAFIGWLFTEILFGRSIDQNTGASVFLAILMAMIIAIPIGGGISMASALGNPSLPTLLKRLLIGCAGGLLGGILGSLPGMCVFALLERIPVLGFIGRVLGFTLIGVGIGVGMGAIDGVFERSLKKMRNGLIGGVIGGFLGGFFFVPILWVVGSPMSSRAFAFVLLGLSIGLFIGLAQVILKEAWLTVEEGFRPGRQVILSQDLVTMGTSEKASMIFIAYGAKGVEPIHLRISRQADGHYLLEDNQSRTGTMLNGTPISGPMPLRDGDAIQFGVNVVRFKERVRQGGASPGLPPASAAPAPTPLSAPKPSLPAAPAAAAPKPAPVPVRAAPAPRPAPAAVKPAVPSAGPAPKPAPATSDPKPQEGRCPICDKKIVGIPGKRRCASCFTTF